MKRHTAGEDYLKTIRILQSELGNVRSVDVASRLHVSKPSVCYAVSVLKESNLIYVDEDMFLHLTEAGKQIADKIFEKHCFFTDMLIDCGVDPKTAHVDACRMEHAICDQSFEQLKEVWNSRKPQP